MAKFVNQKLKLFYLRNILLENTDKNHYISMNEIIERLNTLDIRAERKSIYNDIDLLRELGLEIINHKRLGYAVVKKEYDFEEIELIIQGLDYLDISKNQKLLLKEKLKQNLSQYEAKLLS